MKVKAVLFDIDGTVLDTEKIHMQAWKEAAKEFGFDVPKAALIESVSVNLATAEKVFRKYCGESFDFPVIWDRRVEIAEAIIASREPESLIRPGMKELLSYLNSRHILKAAASMTLAEKTCAHLKLTGLLDAFDLICAGDHVKNGKPDPEIFLLAASGLGVAPQDCVVCEDAPTGIRAGFAGGMSVFYLPDAIEATEADRPYYKARLSSLAEVPAAIEALEAGC